MPCFSLLCFPLPWPCSLWYISLRTTTLRRSMLEIDPKTKCKILSEPIFALLAPLVEIWFFPRPNPRIRRKPLRAITTTTQHLVHVTSTSHDQIHQSSKANHAVLTLGPGRDGTHVNQPAPHAHVPAIRSVTEDLARGTALAFVLE